MNLVAEDGCRLWTDTSGRGDPVVFCHGGPGLWDMAGDLAAMIGDLVTVHRWDQRGGGRSERRGPYTLARFEADLDAVRGGFGHERMAVLGHSWGAQLGLRYALHHPERVTRLIYVSGTGLGWAWHQQYERELQRRLGHRRARFGRLSAVVEPTPTQERELALMRWSTDFADRAAGDRYAERMATPWFPINHDANRSLQAELRREWREEDMVAACRGLPTPALILHGQGDPRPPEAVDSLARALPHAVRVTFPGAGHLPWMEQPERFAAALRAFLHQRP